MKIYSFIAFKFLNEFKLNNIKIKHLTENKFSILCISISVNICKIILIYIFLEQ